MRYDVLQACHIRRTTGLDPVPRHAIGKYTIPFAGPRWQGSTTSVAVDVLHSVAPGLDPVPGTDGKYTIPFADLGGRLDDRLLTDLVLLERRPGAPSAWESLSQTEAVMALYEAAGVPYTANHRAFAAAAFGDIVGRTTLARLRLGDTELPL